MIHLNHGDDRGRSYTCIMRVVSSPAPLLAVLALGAAAAGCLRSGAAGGLPLTRVADVELRIMRPGGP